MKLFKIIGAWLRSRSTEKTTLAGAVAVASSVAVIAGKPDLANQIGELAPVLAAIGGGLIAHKEG